MDDSEIVPDEEASRLATAHAQKIVTAITKMYGPLTDESAIRQQKVVCHRIVMQAARAAGLNPKSGQDMTRGQFKRVDEEVDRLLAEEADHCAAIRARLNAND